MTSGAEGEDPRRTILERATRVVIAGFGVDGDVVVRDGEEGEIVVDVTGPGGTALAARGGEALDALQYVARQLTLRAEGERQSVVVDADGFRARRAAALLDLAERAAAEAVEYGDEIELDPMSPQDRRTVHMALKDREDVVTRSEGNEPRRRIIVEPAD